MFLRVSDGTDVVRELRLGSEAVTIGRDPENTISLPDAAVAPRHARIESRGNFYLILDQGEEGIVVNGRPVRLEILNPGDLISMGRYLIDVAAHPARAAATAGRVKSGKALREVEARRREILNSMARKLRSTLDGLEGNVPLLRARIPEEEPEAQLLEEIEASAKVLGGIVDQFVEFAELEIQSGSEEPQAPLSAPRELVGRAVTAAQELARERQVLISDRLPSALPAVRAYPDRLLAALTQALSRVVRSAAEGGIVALEARSAGQTLELSFSADQGRTIPEGELDLLIARQILCEQGGDVRLRPPMTVLVELATE